MGVYLYLIGVDVIVTGILSSYLAILVRGSSCKRLLVCLSGWVLLVFGRVSSSSFFNGRHVLRSGCLYLH